MVVVVGCSVERKHFELELASWVYSDGDSRPNAKLSDSASSMRSPTTTMEKSDVGECLAVGGKGL